MENFWQSIYGFFTDNPAVCAIIVALTIIATALEKSEKIWTPIQALLKSIKKKKQNKKNKILEDEKQRKEIYDTVQIILQDVRLAKSDVQQLRDKDKDNVDHLLRIDSKLDELKNRIFENERDRIRAELSSCASKCMRGVKMYPEEFIHIQDIYDKYTEELHANHRGTDDYNLIKSFYESQDFIKVK